MKVTLTQNGLDYIKQFTFDRLNESHMRMTYSPHFYFKPGIRFHSSSVSSPKLSNCRQSAPVLEVLLPALLAANPPQAVEICQPRVSISPDFQKRYLSSPSYSQSAQASLNSTMNISNKGVIGNRLPFLAKKPMDAKTRLMKTMQAFKSERSVQFSQVDSVAAQLIAKTLKYNKLLERQETLKKKRTELAQNYKEKIRNSKLEDSIEFDGKTQLIEKWSRIEPARDTKHERYLGRLRRKHLSMADAWWSSNAVKRLGASSNKKVSVPFYKIKAANLK